MLSALLLALALVLLPPPGRRSPRTSTLGRGCPRFPVPGRAGPVLAAALAAGTGAVLSTPLVAVLAGACALLVARAESRRAEALREERRLHALVEALGVVIAELRSGRSPVAAAADAVRSCPDLASRHALTRALRVPDVPVHPPGGGVFADAVDRLAAAVRLSGRTGCSLAAVLTAVEDDVRARLRLERELRTALAGPRASAALLAGLPLLGLAMGSGVGADPWGTLTTTGTGQVLLVVGVGLEMAGVAWTARLVRGAVA